MRVTLPGQGPFAKCGELYGYDYGAVGVLGVSDRDEDHLMVRRDQLNPDWRSVLLNMREGDTVRAWIKSKDTNRFREYEVFLARVDRLDIHGRAQPEQHSHLCP
jgi:hypothetical protein